MPVDTDPGPPEERTLDSDVLSGHSKKSQVKDVWHSTDLDSKGRQFTRWDVVTRRLHNQKPWPVITCVAEAFVIRVHVRILVFCFCLRVPCYVY